MPQFTRRQWLTLIIIGVLDFCNAICVSLQAPFFPREAERKECSSTEYGLVFGIFELVVFLTSPIYGQFINLIGPKVLFNVGILTTSISVVIFGLIDKVPGHVAFITLAFIIRIIEALGNAAFLTSSFAIIAKEFPNHVGATFACLETFFGLGLIAGPVLGGILYAAGGYFLPFGVLGGILFIVSGISFFVLPQQMERYVEENNSPKMKQVLQIPGVWVCSFGIIATSASIGFLGATLEPHLRQFNLGPILLGLIFVINGGIYALTAPFFGWLLDTFLNPKWCALVGSAFIAVAFCVIGPAPFVPEETTLTTVIVGLVLHGFGIAAMLVSSFTDALRSCIQKGLPDNIQTYGLISGLWTSTFALGAFIGPSVAGSLYENFGFRNATLFIVVLHIVLGITVAFFMHFHQRIPTTLYKELSADESILKNKLNGSGVVENGHNGYKNGHLPSNNNSSCDHQSHPCTLNNLVMCSSYASRHSTWASIRESSPLINGGSDYYGSVGNGKKKEFIPESIIVA